MTEGWEVLEVVGTEEEAELIAGYLRNQGIDCVVESVHSHEFPVNVTKLGEVRLEVPADQKASARELLDRREESDVDNSPWDSGSLDAGSEEDAATGFDDEEE